MEIKNQKKVIAILRVLRDKKKPIGSTIIAKLIKQYDINISQRTVRYYLLLCDKAGYTKNLKKRGRMITALGKEKLAKSSIIDKVGLVVSKIDELSYQMDFSIYNCKGKIILNVTTMDASSIKKCYRDIVSVFENNMGMGKYMFIGKSGTHLADFIVPENKIAIGTICSVTINGIFLRYGIPVMSRFGGLLEINNYKPVQFIQLINYDGSTIDPLEIFIKGRMTSVMKVIKTGNGIIGASFREIPGIAIQQAHKLKNKLDRIGLNAILTIGSNGQRLFDIPVTEGKAGMVVIGGLNPIAVVEERGIETRNIAMGTLFNFSDLLSYNSQNLLHHRY